MNSGPRFGVILVIVLVFALVVTGSVTMIGTSYATSEELNVNNTGKVLLSKGLHHLE